jgi:hypothetical protein
VPLDQIAISNASKAVAITFARLRQLAANTFRPNADGSVWTRKVQQRWTIVR